jgi:hypothetical protein
MNVAFVKTGTNTPVWPPNYAKSQPGIPSDGANPAEPLLIWRLETNERTKLVWLSPYVLLIRNCQPSLVKGTKQHL